MWSFAVALAFAGSHSTTTLHVSLASAGTRNITATAVATPVGEVAPATVAATSVGEFAVASAVTTTIGEIAFAAAVGAPVGEVAPAAGLADCAVLSAGSARITVWTERCRIGRCIGCYDSGFITHIAFGISCVG